ncbi:uncharacterized protein isoform X2 [Choristoneura fumiferana]|uniref:uncharacterized protein isoform X1 n=1 Tax=Choristoneura fumiferana TaxID=7141 RepID=UPI003D157018
MACARGVCTADKIFIFINIGFAMYSGALLATAARLAWDPSTYTWFRFLCAAQYRASAAYVLAAGLWLAALVYLAVAAAAAPAAPSPSPSPRQHPQAPRCLHLYAAGVVCLGVSEVGYGAWMAASLAAWWRTAPEAELARRGLDLLHDLRPALLAVDHYRDVVRPVLDMLDEVEREAPNNVYVIIVFAVVGAALQVAAFVLARRLAARASRAARAARADTPRALKEPGADEAAPPDAADPLDPLDPHPPGWRKKANLRMYTILDKIF